MELEKAQLVESEKPATKNEQTKQERQKLKQMNSQELFGQIESPNSSENGAPATYQKERVGSLLQMMQLTMNENRERERHA